MVRISIIIPVYNEGKFITNTLKAIKNQDFKDIEVILADNGSTDGTRELAKKAYHEIKIVIQPERWVIGKSCNKGAKIAKGDLLLFVEGDTCVTNGMLEAYDKAFREQNIVAATGPLVPLEKTSIGIRIGFSLVSVGLVRFFFAIGKPSIIGSNTMVTAAAFRKVHGFNEHMKTYQDWDMSNRLKKVGKIAFVKGAVARTSVRRVAKWGVLKYFTYHASNVIQYTLFHKPREDYEAVR